MPMFVVMQIVGGAAALFLVRFLYPEVTFPPAAAGSALVAGTGATHHPSKG